MFQLKVISLRSPNLWVWMEELNDFLPLKIKIPKEKFINN